MLCISRFILIITIALCTVAVARGDDRMTQLAERITTPGDTSRQTDIDTPESVEAPAASDLSYDANAGRVALSSIENRPLGAVENASGPIITRTGSIEPEGSWVMDTLTSLGLVIGLVLLVRWAWGRFGGRVVTKSSPVVEVLSRTSIAPRNHVLLLRVGARVLVVSDSAGGTRTLANIDEPQEVADLIAAVSAAQNKSISKNFTRLLQGYNGEYDERQVVSEEGGDDGEYQLDHARESVSSLLSRVRLMRKRGGGG